MISALFSIFYNGAKERGFRRPCRPSIARQLPALWTSSVPCVEV